MESLESASMEWTCCRSDADTAAAAVSGAIGAALIYFDNRQSGDDLYRRVQSHSLNASPDYAPSASTWSTDTRSVHTITVTGSRLLKCYVIAGHSFEFIGVITCQLIERHSLLTGFISKLSASWTLPNLKISAAHRKNSIPQWETQLVKLELTFCYTETLRCRWLSQASFALAVDCLTLFSFFLAIS